METEMKILTAAVGGLVVGYCISKAINSQPQKMKPYVVDFDVYKKDEDGVEEDIDDIAVVFNATSKKDAIKKTKDYLHYKFHENPNNASEDYDFTISDAFECDPNYIYTNRYWG